MATNDSKRYYWWRKDTNFYDDHRIVSLLNTKNGFREIYVYDRLCCESTSHNGVIRYSENRAYTQDELAAIVHISSKAIKSSLDLLVHHELILIEEDGTITIPDMCNRIGSETGAAERKRTSRGHLGDNKGTFGGHFGDNVSTLSTRDKRLDIRDYIYILLSSSISRYIEGGYSQDRVNKVLEMMINNISNLNFKVPEKEVIRIFEELMIREDIVNLNGYLVTMLKNINFMETNNERA